MSNDIRGQLDQHRDSLVGTTAKADTPSDLVVSQTHEAEQFDGAAPHSEATVLVEGQADHDDVGIEESLSDFGEDSIAEVEFDDQLAESSNNEAFDFMVDGLVSMFAKPDEGVDIPTKVSLSLVLDVCNSEQISDEYNCRSPFAQDGGIALALIESLETIAYTILENPMFSVIDESRRAIVLKAIWAKLNPELADANFVAFNIDGDLVNISTVLPMPMIAGVIERGTSKKPFSAEVYFGKLRDHLNGLTDIGTHLYVSMSQGAYIEGSISENQILKTFNALPYMRIGDSMLFSTEQTFDENPLQQGFTLDDMGLLAVETTLPELEFQILGGNDFSVAYEDEDADDEEADDDEESDYDLLLTLAEIYGYIDLEEDSIDDIGMEDLEQIAENIFEGPYTREDVVAAVENYDEDAEAVEDDEDEDSDEE